MAKQVASLSLIAVAVFSIALTSSAAAERGGVVRIHFSNSLDPDLSSVTDTYMGPGPVIRPHMGIDSIPGGHVSAYDAGINLPAPPRTDFGEGPYLPEYDWTGVPELHPVWVLGVQGDSAYVVHKGFADGRRRGTFPLQFARISRIDTVEDTQGRLKGMTRIVRSLGYVPIQPDGVVQDQLVNWSTDDRIAGIGSQVGCSPLRRIALFRDNGRTELRDGDGGVISILPIRVKWSKCFDVPKRVVAIAVQDITGVDPDSELRKIVVLDYEGHTLYETDWTGCHMGSVLMGENPNVIWFSLSQCNRAGEYLLRIDDKKVYSLGSLPRMGRKFSPDGRYVLVNDESRFGFYDARDPESLDLIWQEMIGATVRDVAVSDGGEYVALRTRGENGTLLYIYVLSGKDGSPVCRLVVAMDRPMAGPLAFMGDYLFAGIGFGLIGTPWDTESIYLFDLDRGD